MLRISELKLPLDHAPEALAALIARTLGVPVEAIVSHNVYKRSFDARKVDLLTVYICDVQLSDAKLEAALLAKHAGHPHIQSAPDMRYVPPASAPEGLQTRPYRGDELGIVVHADHPLAKLKACSFAQTLEHDHVGLPASTAVHTMLARAAAIIGKPIFYRAVVSTFDASLRCVGAGLGLAVVPRQIAEMSRDPARTRVVTLKEEWAKRRFAICYRDFDQLSPAARLLVDHLSALPVLTSGLTRLVDARKRRGS